MPSCGVCLFICPSVCLSRLCILSKQINISSNFSTSGSHTIPFFPYQKLWQYFNEDSPNKGVECRWVKQKSRFSTNIWLHRVLSTVRPPIVIHTAAPDRGKLVTLIAGKGVFIATQLNSTDPVEQRTAKSVVFLFMTSRPTNWVNCCSRCERVDNSTSSWVQLSWVELSCVAINGQSFSCCSQQCREKNNHLLLRNLNMQYRKSYLQKLYGRVLVQISLSWP